MKPIDKTKFKDKSVDEIERKITEMENFCYTVLGRNIANKKKLFDLINNNLIQEYPEEHQKLTKALKNDLRYWMKLSYEISGLYKFISKKTFKDFGLFEKDFLLTKEDLCLK